MFAIPGSFDWQMVKCIYGFLQGKSIAESAKKLTVDRQNNGNSCAFSVFTINSYFAIEQGD
jgi:hypothetical protein